MAYTDLIQAKNGYSKLIGTTITFSKVLYLVNSIAIFPREKTLLYLSLRNIDLDPDFRFRDDVDTELMLMCTNLSTQEEAVIPFIEVF